MSAQNNKKNPQNTNDSKKKIIIGIVCLILLLNVMWTIMQNKFTPKLDEVKAGMAALEQRITKLEQGGRPDVADLKEDFTALRAIADKFSERLNESIKTEEEQLKELEAQVEAKRARVEELKKFSEE